MSELCVLLVLLSLASLLIAHHAAAQPPTTPTYFIEDCQPEYGNYTNSAYGSNLNSVLTILSLEAKTDPYSNTSAGTRRDMVYGQYYCRGDISTDLCGDCIKEAARSVMENCPNAKAAVMYYEECTLRYANQSMVGIEAEHPGYRYWSLINVTDPENFGVVLNDTRDKVVETASFGNGSLHFATREGVVSESETVYFLAQCSPYLNGTQCDTCLGSAFEVLASAGHWPVYGMDFKPSCQIRYSISAFYQLPNTTAGVSPAPSSYSPQTSAVTDSSVNLTPPSTSPAAAANQVCRSEYGNYSTNSTYESNLKSVLISLQASNASSFHTSAGSGADMVYGQYYCRGDISTQLCRDCIKEAAQSVLKKCPNFKGAIMWYEDCTLRYLNQSMLGIWEERPNAFASTIANVTDPEKFVVVLRETRDKVIETASYGNGSLHFATGEGVVSEFETVYCLVQCSPDLDDKQCETCLRSLYGKFTEQYPGNVSAQELLAFYGSCQMRYSTLGAFYQIPNSTVSQASPTAAAKGKDSAYYVTRAVVPTVVVGLLILLAVSFCFIKRKIFLSFKWQHPDAEVGDEESEVQNTDCIQFDLKTIEAATNSFSMSNKLGQGGFGMVYQGILRDGQDVAVKRLSKNSGQGAKEFKTEVEVVARLQHKNLVRLVGCCVDGEERLLVYEFLRNLSLDCFLYDPNKSAYLTWKVRYKIIQGIARGLHYLHEDSRVKIVHRDLKISNILLTDNLDPKIADFGLAKLVNVDQTSDNTTKVVGTYGYMSPEYALAGRYSTKSDVYSFGVIVLEILSGKINSRFYDISQGKGLLNFAWRIWNEGEIEKLMDPVLENNYSRIETERCLQIGLLCVQDDEANRPPMHAVLVMLHSNTVEIPRPFSPSHSSYINKLSSCDETQEGTSRHHQNDSSKSSFTLSITEMDLTR